MKPLLRALIVEDSENDTILLLRDLERSDYQIAHERVETAEDLRAALDRETWDILFCDFTMPRFGGRKALEIVNERNLDLPFIFVSGTVGEDLAVQAMKEGAHDYVMKNNLTRLVPAMERELREAKVRRLRREAEEDMRVSEYKYRHLFESLRDAAFLIEMETGRIIDTNPEAEVLLGRPRAGIVGMRERQLFPEHLARAAAHALWSSGGRFESQVLQKNGGLVPVYVSVSKLQLYDRRFLLALFHDITGRKRSEEKIREQANLLELAHEAIFVRSLEGKIQYWNRGAEQLYGWTAAEAMGGNFVEMADEDHIFFAEAKEILLKEGRWSGEVRKLTKARHEVFVASSWTLVRDAEGNPSSVLVIDTDTTEKKQMEIQFLRAERLELIGTVGAGIAHDLNNILQVIITNLDLANSMLAMDGRLRRYLVDASRGAARATSLASRLLTFSKGGVPIKQHLDIAAILTPAVLLALSGSKLKPLFDFQPDLYPVIGDPVELTQVIESVVMNGCEAAAQTGNLLVCAENIDGKVPPPFDLPAGRYVRIGIEDNGTGIPEGVRNRRFEDRFPTKRPGLDLATVKSIMQQHRGGISIQSLADRGTAVSLLVPAAPHSPEPTPVAIPSRPPVKSSERILVIDDEEMILSVVGSMLNSLGYECAEAKDGVEGCNAYVRAKAAGEPFAAVLLDATIPNGLAGEEALKSLLKVDPEVRAILCTGYADSDLFKKAEQIGFRAVLAKPFSISQFVSVFKKVLS
jgi:PAS domain S-box-containing protein